MEKYFIEKTERIPDTESYNGWSVKKTILTKGYETKEQAEEKIPKSSRCGGRNGIRYRVVDISEYCEG